MAADMNESISLPPGKIPPEVENRIKDAVSRYTVALIILDSHNNYLTVASGTFVLVRGRRAILTARHVIDKIEYNLGLAFTETDRYHKFLLEKWCLKFACAPKGETESSGPDMGLIYINDPTKLDTINAIKSYFNLDYYAGLIREETAIPSTDQWVVAGFPEELSDIKTHQQNLAGKAYFVDNPKHFERDGYDYFDFNFRSSDPGCVPSSLGGMSGGGVWRAKVFYNGEVYVPEDSDWLILSGVNFYQSEVSDGGRSLRTHGRKSIYVKLFEWA